MGNVDSSVQSIEIFESSPAAAELKLREIALNECLSHRFYGKVAGAALGVAAGFPRRSLRPFIACFALGSAADLLYGYFGPCADQCAEYLVAFKGARAFAAQINNTNNDNNNNNSNNSSNGNDKAEE